MNALEWNKIIAALLMGILLYKGIQIFAEGAFEVAGPEVRAYVVEGLETEAEEMVAVEEAPAAVDDIMALLAVASPEQGQRVFRRCQACHDANQDAGHKIGPNLFGVIGAPLARHDDYGYSAALTDHGGTWDFALMNDYLASPADAIPGNKMTFGGVPKAGDRAALIAYMNSKSDSPLALPSPAAAEEAPEPEAAEEAPELEATEGGAEPVVEESAVQDGDAEEVAGEEVGDSGAVIDEAEAEAVPPAEPASEAEAEAEATPEAAPEPEAETETETETESGAETDESGT